jgi:putative alpha-1,2-mannosidase
MKKSHFIFIFSFFITVTLFGQQQNLAQYVNPFVGTDYHGHTYPGAIVPFGMIQPGPDTRLDGWDGCSAYHYSDNIIYGFSHTHLSGTGCSDYGDILLMPFTGKPSVINKEYASSFLHQNETASPGYYAVLLNKDKVKVELTASKRVAVHRYTFPDGNSKSKGVILDLKHRDKVFQQNSL